MNLAKNLTHDPVNATNVAVQILYGPDYSTAISAVSKLAPEREPWLQNPQITHAEIVCNLAAASWIIAMDIITGAEHTVLAGADKTRGVRIIKYGGQKLNGISPCIINLGNHQHIPIVWHGDH